MPEFVLDTSGQVCRTEARDYGTISRCTLWRDLDAFTAGYVEALFFTEDSPGLTTEEWRAECEAGTNEGALPGDVGFADLAPETLARIIEDCAKFQRTGAWYEVNWIEDEGDLPSDMDAQAGRDFWYTRNGHGVGFWDGDWPEPYATALTEAADAFGSVDAYLGDDGKVYLS